MTALRALRMAVFLCALLGVGLIAFAISRIDRGERGGGGVTLLTSLPLVRGEGDIAEQLAGTSAPDPLFVWLDKRRALRPIDAVTADTLAPAPLLLAIQPRALAPEELVAIDGWVRSGGRALIVADPLLDWPSRHAIGDARRAPVTDMLGALERHWGLDMAPGGSGWRSLPGGGRIGVTGAGRWVGGGRCRVALDGLMADCALGRGRALMLADADFLHADRWEKPFLWRGSEAPQFLLSLIRALEEGGAPAAVPPARRIMVPLAAIGGGLVLLFVIPLLLFVGLAVVTRHANRPGTSAIPTQTGPPDAQKVGPYPG